MKVLILTDKGRWFENFLEEFQSRLLKNYSKKIMKLDISYNHLDVDYEYDACFLLSYSKVVKIGFLNLNKYNLVVHASNLPEGKGMSPLTWQVLEGKSEIPFCLLEAREKLDSGEIYLKKYLKLDGSELVDELRAKQVEMTFNLVEEFINRFEEIVPNPQVGEGFQYERRRPSDSELDLKKTIDEQFNLLRVCDNEAYPAFFIKYGQKYFIRISKD